MDIQTLIIIQIVFDVLLILFIIFSRRQSEGQKIINLNEIKEILTNLEKQNQEREEMFSKLIKEIEQKKKEIRDLLVALDVKEKNLLNNLPSNDPFLEAPRFLREGCTISETAKKVGLPEKDIKLIFDLISKGN